MDLSSRKSAVSDGTAPRITVKVPVEEHETLRDCMVLLPDVQAAVYSAEYDGKRVVINATEEELSGIAACAEVDADNSTGKRKHRLKRLCRRILKALD